MVKCRICGKEDQLIESFDNDTEGYFCWRCGEYTEEKPKRVCDE